MGTWVTCPNCVENLPHKYQNKKERKEIHQATCNECKYSGARAPFEKAVKRGIWLKNWKRAVAEFNKAANQFQNIGDSESQLIVELMRLRSEIEQEKNETTAIKAFGELTSGRYNGFLNKNFVIPEFEEFDPLYLEARAWQEFIKIKSFSKPIEKINQMRNTSRAFFNLGYCTLFFSKFILPKSLITKITTNMILARTTEADTEEKLGDIYANMGKVDNASHHYRNAIIAYTSLEDKKKTRYLKNIRTSLRMESTCWICGTRSKGHGTTFSFKYTNLTEQQHTIVMEKLTKRQKLFPTMLEDTIYSTKQHNLTIDDIDVKAKKGKRGIYLTTCKVCQGLIDELAQDVVDKSLIPVWNAVNNLHLEVTNIRTALNSMQMQLNSLLSRSKLG